MVRIDKEHFMQWLRFHNTEAEYTAMLQERGMRVEGVIKMLPELWFTACGWEKRWEYNREMLNKWEIMDCQWRAYLQRHGVQAKQRSRRYDYYNARPYRVKTERKRWSKTTINGQY